MAIVHEDFVVEMRAGGTSGRADIANDIATLDGLAGLYAEFAQMAVPRQQAESVVEDDEVAVISGVGRGFDRAVRRRVDGLPLFGRDVESLVKARLPGERVAS